MVLGGEAGQAGHQGERVPQGDDEPRQTAAARRVDFVFTRAERDCLLAALEAAHSLGYYEAHDAHRPRPATWRDVPRRGEEETATERFTATVAPLHLRTIERAAKEQLGERFRLSVHGGPAPLQAFMLGSALRFIAAHLDRAHATQVSESASQADRRVAGMFLARLDGCYQGLEGRAHEPFALPERYVTSRPRNGSLSVSR
jgi:hypothetical protein